MSYIKQMLEAHPVKPSDHDKTVECITACYSCSEACNACADACLGEKDPGLMAACIRTCADCADLCLAVARIVSRLTHTNKKLAGILLRACADVCHLCHDECDRHAEHMAHCKICCEACLRCEEACCELVAEPAR